MSIIQLLGAGGGASPLAWGGVTLEGYDNEDPNAGTRTIAAPTTIEAGDLLILAVMSRYASGTTYSWPSGFTQRVAGTEQGLATKVATGSEGSFTFGYGSGSGPQGDGFHLAYAVVKQATYDTVVQAQNVSNNTGPGARTAAGAPAIAVFFAYGRGGTSTITFSAGLTPAVATVVDPAGTAKSSRVAYDENATTSMPAYTCSGGGGTAYNYMVVYCYDGP